MENTMKPARLPYELTSKYMLKRIIMLYVGGTAIVLLLSMLPLSDKAILPIVGLWFFAFFCLLGHPLYFDRVVFPEGIQVRLFGRGIRQIPVSDLKILCAVGSDREQYLCLSGWDLEELAQKREQVLQRGTFTRQDLKFLKEKTGWKEHFAKEYLLHPRKTSRKLPVLWFPFDPVVAIFMRRMYPNLPYVDPRNPMMGRLAMQKPDQIPFSGDRFWLDEEGIHIRGELSNTERRWFRADRIRTILRVDRFVSLSKTEPAYGCYLLVSELSLDELAARGRGKRRQQWKRRIIDQLPEAEEMYAAEFYFSSYFTWNRSTATECPIKYTPEAEAMLRKICPHARWVDYSKKWQSSPLSSEVFL